MSGKAPQIRVPRHQEASLTDEGDFTAEAGSSRLQMPLRGRKMAEQECWSIGVLECWGAGKSNTPSLHHSALGSRSFHARHGTSHWHQEF
jgi:hypothetical protein